MTALGHEDQFAPPGPSDRRRFGQPTFTRTDGNERAAPISAARWVSIASRSDTNPSFGSLTALIALPAGEERRSATVASAMPGC